MKKGIPVLDARGMQLAVNQNVWFAHEGELLLGRIIHISGRTSVSIEYQSPYKHRGKDKIKAYRLKAEPMSGHATIPSWGGAPRIKAKDATSWKTKRLLIEK